MFSGLSLSFSDVLISLFCKTGQLLEATAKAVQPVIELGESGLAVADGLSNLLKVNKLSSFKLWPILKCKFVVELQNADFKFQLHMTLYPLSQPMKNSRYSRIITKITTKSLLKLFCC